MQPRVLQGDGQPQTRTTGRTRACRVGAPEAAEHPGRLTGLEPHPVVAHRDGDRTARGGELDYDVLAVAVLHGVDDEVAQHPLDPAGVGLGDHGLLVADDAYPRALALGERLGAAQDPSYDLSEVYRLGLQGRRARVEAADLQQVREQCLEPVQLVGQEFGRPRGHRIEVHARVVDDIGRHPYGRQRRPQFVRDVGHEPALHPRQVLQLLDLQLEVLGHLVEGLAEPRDVVLAGDLHALLEAPRGQPLGDPGGHPHRRDDLPYDEPGDGPQEYDDEEPGGGEGPLDQAERLLLLGEREEVVQLVGIAVRVVDLLAHDERRLGFLAVAVDDPGVALGGGRAVVDPRAQVLGDAGGRVDVAGAARAASAAAVHAGGQGHHVEGALAAAGERRHEVAHPLDDVLGGVASGRGAVVGGTGGRLVCPLLGHGEAARGLALGGLHLGVEQAVAHLADDDEAEQQDDAQGHQQGGDDDLELDVAPPQPHDGQQRPADPAHEQAQDRAALDPALQQPALQQAPPAGARRLPADRPPRTSPGPPGRRSGTVPGHVSSVPPCNRHLGRSPRSPAAPGPSRPWNAAAGHAR